MVVLSVGNMWGETAVATTAGTYSFGSTNIGAANKFAEISTNSVFIYRWADNYSTSNSGIKAVSGNQSGFVFYTTSPMTLSATIYQNSKTAETVTIYVKSITSAFFQNLVDGTANSTTVSAPSFSDVGTFSVVGSTTKQEYSGTYGSTLSAGYYYVYARSTAGTCNTYHRSITLAAPSCPTLTVSRGGTADGTYTVGNDGGTLTCSATTGTITSYQWKQYSSGQGIGDTIDAVGSGATTASFTPHPLSAGTYYYLCRAKNACGDVAVTSTSGTFVFNAAGCPSYSFHTGGNDVKTNNTQSCFVQVGSSHEWQLTDYTIPADTKFFVGERGWWYNDNLGSNNSRSSAQTWADEMYLAMSFDSGDAAGSPKLGQATGATGTIRIYDNSDWNNLNAAFIPDGYVLKFGSSYGLFTEGPTNEFLSPLVTYNSTTAGYAVSVGVTDENDEYVSTANTQEMRHIFLKDNCGWSADGAKFAIYYWSGDSNGWCGFLQTVPGETNLYEGWIPASYTNLKFVRFSSSKTAVGSWDDKWNETSDLSVTSSQNYFTMSSFSSGSWSAYQKKGKFRINANYKDKNWFVRFIPNYILTYDKNDVGASGTMEEQGVAVDAVSKNVTVLANGFTAPAGYHFDTWKTAPSSGTSYAAGSTYNLTADATLYAQWAPTTYTITLAAGDHGAANQSATVVYDATALSSITHVTAAASSPHQYYDLTGYYDGETKVLNIDGTFAATNVTGYITDGKWSKADDCTLTAKWTGKVYSITYKENDNSTVIGGLSPSSYTYGVGAVLPTPTKSGYTFESWYLAWCVFEEGGSGNGFVDGCKKTALSASDHGSATYLARWYQTVTLDKNGGDADGAVVAWCNESGTTSLSAPTRAGYSVEGYYAEAGCTNKVMTDAGVLVDYSGYVSSGKWIHSGATTLYAKWTKESGCIKWSGTPSSWTAGKITINSLVLEASATAPDINTSSNNQVWSGHTETVMALQSNGVYVQGHFSNGSEINTLTISAANNNGTAGTDKKYLVLFCANSSFSSGVTGQLHAAPSYKDAQNDTKLIHEFTAPAGTKYFRIYRKLNEDVGNYKNGGDTIGDGQTTRIYGIEVCPVPVYEVTYKANGGTGEDMVDDDAKTIAENTFTRSGYAFMGWNTASDGSGTPYAVGTTVTEDLTLFAQWEKAYTITLDNQSADLIAGTASISVIYNHNDNLLARMDPPIKSGYYFGGYYTETGGAGVKVINESGDVLASATGYTDASRNWVYDGNKTLYAKWTALTVSLTISPASINPHSSTPVTFTITTNAPSSAVDPPYYFAIYNLGNPAHITGYLNGDHPVSDGSTTVAIDKDFGLWSTQAVILWKSQILATSAAQTLTVECTTPDVPDGLTAGSITTNSVTFTITDDNTPESYDIYYSTNSTAPTPGTAATTTTPGNTKEKSVTGLESSTTYYAWVRAVCDASHKSSWVALTGSSFTTEAPPTYSVTYNDHRLSLDGVDEAPVIDEAGGTVPTDANSYLEGATVSVLGNTGDLTFIIDGAEATFRGWTNNSLGYSNPYYTAGSTFAMPASNVTLYAVWSFPIEYYLNGGTINDVSYDTYYIYTNNIDNSGIMTATLPTNVTKVGYTFEGWYHKSDFSDVRRYGVEGYWYGEYEAFAKWTENLYDITYDSNGGSGSMSNTHGHYVTIANNNFTNSGYIFNGWNTAADGSGISYDAGEEIELTANLTLYAQWKLDYIITWGNVQIGGAGATITPNLGGGNYTITVNTGVWSGSLTADMLSASAGVTITNVTVDNSGSPKTATLTFSVGADVVGSTITLTIDVPAHGDYSAKTSDHVISIDRCEGVATVWDFTTNTFLKGGSWSTSAGAENKAYATDGSTILKYYAGGGGDVWSSSNAQLQTQGTTATSTGTSKKQITQKYFQFPTLSGKGKISVTYGTNKSTLKIYEATSTNIYGLEPVITLTSDAPASNTYSFKSDKTYYMTMESSKVYFKKITFVDLSGSEITPTLSWETDLSGGVAKETGDADFTHTASTTSNTLGTITYSSSNTAVATVNASTGKVHIVGAAGSAVITATLSASGCYSSATISYTINVTRDCDDVAGTIETTDLGCDIQMTVSGHTTSGESVSYQWYKVGSPDVTVGTNSSTFTTNVPGEYYVVVTNTGSRHCAMASTNTIVVEERSGFEISKIIDYWYIKNGRRTPDIELVQTNSAGTFTVKVNGSTIDNIGGCHFYLGDDGIIYLKGTQDNGEAPSGLTDGENITLQITVNQECGDGTSYVEIEIRCQGATTRPSIAFVVDGDKGDDFADENEEHSVETALYKFLDYGEDLSGAFDLTGQNIYSTTDEKLIREHYSQFDAVLVTDDPSTKATPKGISGDDAYKTKGYVNAFGALIDVRPILTMEAYVSALANWDCVKGDPTSPNPRQYEMRLQCKNHEIYGGLPTPSSRPGISNVWEEIIDGEEYRHVIMVDSTLSPYTGIAYNVQTGGNEKPALQGFTLEAMGELLGLGVISDGALQAGIERQHEPAARMMILGINAKALPHALTPEGKKVIENAITYLLKTNMEDVDDCSNFFVGGTDGHEKDWSTLTNWSKGSLPSNESKVRILAPCEISNAVGYVAQIEIASSGSSKTRYISRGDATCDGNLVIAADGALVVNGKIYSAVAPYFNSAKLAPTSPSELKIEANSLNTGALIFDNSDGKAQATVEMYSASYWEVVEGKKKKWWSYVGVPITNVDIPNYFYLGFTYLYDETSGWIKKWDGSVLQPFDGIGLSMQSGHKETFYGTLASTATKEISLTKTAEAGNGENLIGNSWIAPIQIANFETADFGGATATVYVYNTGRDDVYHNPTYVAATEDNDGAATAGQWVGVPVNVAGLPGYTGLKVVPAMNAFQVNTSSEATLTLDYNKLVRKNAVTNANINNPLRAPRRTESVSEIEALMRVRVTGEYTHTDVWLLQDEQFTDEFDNGWEAKYQDCDNRSAQMYAESELGRMAFIAKPNIDGTVLGFAPSRDGHEYTFSFYYLGDEALYLNDMQLEVSTLIDAENTYTFTYSEEDMAERFIISRQAFGAPAVTTGNERISDDAKPIKFIKDDHIFILVRGILYDITGKVVR
ncbi:MAG: InlB B-repeat-containing protein [Paludibacteraceae bacterium]|nr:InlB B-repeat-containing protein [Paludibacteraceae bacterium]